MKIKRVVGTALAEVPDGAVKGDELEKEKVRLISMGILAFILLNRTREKSINTEYSGRSRHAVW